MRVSPFLLALLLLAPSGIVQAQSLFYCSVGDETLPVAAVRAGDPLCFTGDSLVKGHRKKAVLHPVTSFGEGFVEVEVVKESRSGVTQIDGVLHFESSRNWYLLVCRLVPDRDMSDCYFSIQFDTYGKTSYLFRSLGEMKSGEEKMLRVYLKLNYEMPKQLHVFSGMEEIRTSLIPAPYRYEGGGLAFASIP